MNFIRSPFTVKPASHELFTFTLMASMSCLTWGDGAGLAAPPTGAPGVNVLDFFPNSAARAAPFSPLNIRFAVSRSFSLMRRKSKTLQEIGHLTVKNSQVRLRKSVSDTTILSLLPQLREPVDYVIAVVLLGGNGVAEEAERL